MVYVTVCRELVYAGLALKGLIQVRLKCLNMLGCDMLDVDFGLCWIDTGLGLEVTGLGFRLLRRHEG